MTAIWAIVLLWLNCKEIGAFELSEQLDSFEKEIANSTLLDVLQGATYNWRFETEPYKHYMEYFETPDLIDKGFLNVSAEFDLNPFNDTLGVWAFPHIRRFGLEFHAYFTQYYRVNIYDKIEIRAYLHGDAKLLYFKASDAVNASETFKGNGDNHWQVFDADYKRMDIRLEIHTSNYGDFGLLDRVTGFYTPATRPPPFEPSTEKPVDEEQDPEPSNTVSASTEASIPKNGTTTSNPGTTEENMEGVRPAEPGKPSNFAPAHTMPLLALIVFILSLMM